jgi:SMC interacting uncharacterized protein involved in chromosome segregation
MNNFKHAMGIWRILIDNKKENCVPKGNKIKWLKYNSDTVLPQEITKMIIKTEEKIKDDRYELDKINCNMGRLRKDLILWFDKHLIKGKE